MTELAQYFPAGVTWDIPTRPPPSWRSRSEGGHHAAGGHRPGVLRDVPVHAELPRHADPHAGGAGGAAGHAGRDAGPGLFDQRADHVRHGAGHRHSGGRRHRGGRERRAHHGRGRPVAARRHGQGHGPDQRRHHRHHRGAGVRVRADGLLRRRGGQYLPSVLGHAGGVDRLLGLPGAVAHAGAVRHHAAAHPGRPPRSAASSAGSTAPSA